MSISLLLGFFSSNGDNCKYHVLAKCKNAFFLFRFALFSFLFETLIHGLILGWKEKKPNLTQEDGSISELNHELMKTFKVWVEHYHTIEVHFQLTFFYSNCKQYPGNMNKPGSKCHALVFIITL